MPSMKVIVTDHAISRLIARYDRQLTNQEAEHLLQDALQSRSTKLRGKSLNKDVMWQLHDPDVVAVLRRDGRDNTKAWVVTTVLSYKQAGIEKHQNPDEMGDEWKNH